tara:strand:+ start:347 stop:499 length:153 start_codon:yes stop_codon:yes gene_type:complete
MTSDKMHVIPPRMLMKTRHSVYNFLNLREYTLQEDDIERHMKDMLYVLEI